MSLVFALAFAGSWIPACGGDDEGGGAAGGGTSGASGTAGSAGATMGGSAGSGGTAGTGGTPSAGSGGTPMAGSSGSAGSAGSGGTMGGEGGIGGEGGESGAGEGGQPEGGEGGQPEGGAGGEGGAGPTEMCASAALSITHLSADPNQAHEHMPPLMVAARTELLSMINTGTPLVFAVPMDGTNTHSHNLVFTAGQLTTLRTGGTIAMITTTTGGPGGNPHTHTYSIECAP